MFGCFSSKIPDYDVKYMNETARLHQIGSYLTRLERDKSQVKSDMISAAVNGLIYAVKSANDQEVEPFKPLIRVGTYAGQCRRKISRE